MKKNVAVMSALFIGLSYCLPETVVMAMENTGPFSEDENLIAEEGLSLEDNDSYVDQAPLNSGSSLIEQLWKEIADDPKENEDLKKGVENETWREAEGGEPKTVDSQAAELKNLQIPQKLEVVIDPWEMDGKGQVYSEEYIICNTGDTSGILTLSNLACRPQEQSEVVVKMDKGGLHDGNDKNIYMEMLFGNGEHIIFSSEKSQYQTELKPGEELSVRFSGEVNENASVEWTKWDVAISVTYFWESEDVMESLEEGQTNISDEDVMDVSKGQQQTNAGEEVSAENQTNDANGNEPVDTLPNVPSIEDAENEQKADSGEENNLPDGADKEEMKNIDLQEPQKIDVNIDSWKTDEKGRLVSPPYLLYNAGDTPGTLTWSELICKPQEPGGVKILTDKKSLSDSGDKSVYMELTLGNGEKAVLSQESSIYEVNLEPGEKLEVRFIGEIKGNLFESRKEGDIAVTAVCTWDRE